MDDVDTAITNNSQEIVIVNNNDDKLGNVFTILKTDQGGTN